MKFPDITNIEFVILGQLLAGRIPAQELRHNLATAYGWQRSNFFSIALRMSRKGLIERLRYAPTDGEEIRQESWYSITEAGRLHWRESYGFFRSICDHWSSEAASVRMSTVPPLKKANGVLNRREVRVPTVEEAALIVQKGPLEFGWIFATARELDVLPLQLISVEVEDYSPAKGELRLVTPSRHKSESGSERTVPVNASAARWLRRSIGDRSDGPIFLTPQGKPWEEVNLRMHFGRLRRKLGLPTNVMMQNARTKSGEQLRDLINEPDEQTT